MLQGTSDEVEALLVALLSSRSGVLYNAHLINSVASISAIILEYEQSGVMKSKCIDLLDLGVRYVKSWCVLTMKIVLGCVVQMCWVLWMK